MLFPHQTKCPPCAGTTTTPELLFFIAYPSRISKEGASDAVLPAWACAHPDPRHHRPSRCAVARASQLPSRASARAHEAAACLWSVLDVPLTHPGVFPVPRGACGVRAHPVFPWKGCQGRPAAYACTALDVESPGPAPFPCARGGLLARHASSHSRTHPFPSMGAALRLPPPLRAHSHAHMPRFPW